MGKRGCILLENEKPKGGGMEKLASFIVDKRNLFFRFKRLLERPFIRKYAKHHGWQDFMRFWHVEGGRK